MSWESQENAEKSQGNSGQPQVSSTISMSCHIEQINNFWLYYQICATKTFEAVINEDERESVKYVINNSPLFFICEMEQFAAADSVVAGASSPRVTWKHDHFALQGNVPEHAR